MSARDDTGHPPLVLASASPRRARLLGDRGIRVTVRPSHDPERPVPGLSPGDLAARHARNKAERVAPGFPRHVVLGADTVVVIDGEALGKPADRDEARRMLARLAGRGHEVITAVCLLRLADGWIDEFRESTRVVFRRLDAAGIDAYLALIDPLDKAGAYAAQEHRELIIETMDGSESNVIGLPVERVLERMAAIPACQREQSPSI